MESNKKRKSQVPSVTLASFINALTKVSDQIVDVVDLEPIEFAEHNCSSNAVDDAAVVQHVRQIIVDYLNARNFAGISANGSNSGSNGNNSTNNAGSGIMHDDYRKERKQAKLSKNHQSIHAITMSLMNEAGGSSNNTTNNSSNGSVSRMYTGSNTAMFARQPSAWMYFCNMVMNELIVELETKTIVFLFPKEMLKYFMATAHRFIKPVDFSETGQIAKGHGSNGSSNNNNNNNNTNTNASTSRKSLAANHANNNNNSNGASGGGKHSSNLTNGTILNEYGKGLDVFIAAMSRSDNTDISALKQVIKRPFCINPKLYAPIVDAEFRRPQLLVDTKSIARPNYAQIPFTNHKQMFVLVNANIVMVYDNQQFVVPSSIVEREFTWTVKQSSRLSNPDDFLILDVLIASKAKVIDVLAYKYNGETTLPQAYDERLNLAKSMLPNIQVATYTSNPWLGKQTDEAVTPTGLMPEASVAFAALNTIGSGASSGSSSSSSGSQATETSYISKPLVGFGPTYIYNKYNLTAAAVGISGKAVVLAFFENGELAIKSKTSIVGPLSILLTVKEMQNIPPAPTPPTDQIEDSDKQNSATQQQQQHQLTNVTIKHRGSVYPIRGDVRDVQFFKSVLPVELRDGNRLGCISDRDVSSVTDFKPVVVKRDTVMYDDIKHSILQNMSVIYRIFNDDDIACAINSEKIAQIRAILQPTIKTPI